MNQRYKKQASGVFNRISLMRLGIEAPHFALRTLFRKKFIATAQFLTEC